MKRKAYRSVLIIFILALCFLLILMAHRDSKATISSYIEQNHEELKEFADGIAEVNNADMQTTYQDWTVFYWRDANMVEFVTETRGLIPSSSYKGFYYSPDNMPLGYQGVKTNFIKVNNGWRSETVDGDNSEYTEKIMAHWYWFEMNF
ncbi:hypothetical protein [Oscillibacter sp.]|uniref:hypothetical protein n=1 Tax=Oscillibacter sp. TaxID=1945593 RepID=UPI00289A13A7|nr:hypothetical protein [Oscillibacter sp.]